jgi:CubicO group peptidase (beta-lactamase class C family)
MVRSRWIALVGVLLCLTGCAGSMVAPSLQSPDGQQIASAAAAPVAAAAAPLFRWEPTDPGAMGLDLQALSDHEALCKETGADACLVIYKGKIVQEYLSERYIAPLWAMSATKSVTALLVGMLIDAGKIKSVDEPVCTYLADWCDGDKAKVTVRHLLTMTAGFARTYAEGVPSARDKNAFARKQPLMQAPGAGWIYSNEGVQLLSAIMEKAAGESVSTFASKSLFGPLGMTQTRLSLDSVGNSITYANMMTTPRDLARIGLMMLARGTWEDKQIVSSHWVDEATRPIPSVQADDGMGYGYLWWRSPDKATYVARGEWENSLFVSPGNELVVVRMQNHEEVSYDGYLPRAFSLFAKLVPARAATAGS